MKTKLDKYFRISQRGSTIGTELIGGATTFAHHGVHPGLHDLGHVRGARHQPDGRSAVHLRCMTAVSTIAMGLIANVPIVLAPVLVIPNLVAAMIARRRADLRRGVSARWQSPASSFC